ncbi:MAG: hypothetical protein HYS18_08125 [Burkholderiales bacterium]|nr:hypothetical protein [Burkholderiales bacterium]
MTLLDSRLQGAPVARLPAIFIGLLLLAALFLGLLTTTANPVVIGMGLGLVGGAFLLTAPRLLIWLVIFLSLATGALLSLAGPEYMRLVWPVSILAFLLWPLALVHMTRQKHLPVFVWVALLFVLLAILSTALNWYSLSQLIAGFKRYFQAYGLLFALAALPFASSDMQRWQKLFLLIALLQLPFALYEFLVLVPLRGGLQAGSEATDVVAGTFGANLNGGSANAEMAAFLLIVTAFLLARRRAGLLSGWRTALLGILCLIPLGLGETKVVLLLLPLVGAIVMRKDFFRAPLRYLPGMLVLVILTAVLGWVYVTLMIRGNFADVLANTLSYNLESTGYGDALLNRSTAISFWWERHGWHDPVGLLFGHGIGSSFWAANNPLSGHIGMHYPRYGIDLTTLSTLLWDMGLVGAGMYAGILVSAWVAANRLWRRALDAWVRADALAIQAAIAVFAVFLIYSNSSVNLQAFQIVIAAVLGYLAYLCRTHPPAPAIKKKYYAYL